ncbi:RNA polymerase sigma factor SigJ [Saccharothrix violaceirubra]|uniref:RNA polymerase sigma-70 factor (ECF subfamily) n=1 Tax=Saccharothrix violaceirubra TaxID=413306 RepID=A0A7W7T8B3_9PSEU|nr:RNA polymerase sigma factor SigJ [Saccharothrix violaceirubra]MBB4967842.1 RNA polymerase sigma-70 factor (ECF subfamily) [Saccharothrix violaceirubra]
MTTADPDLAAAFDEHRSHLVGVAYRLTGSVADAEDAVQEAWLRLANRTGEPLVEPRAWLTTVVGRICLDRLRSAAVRRESYVGSWLPEPVVTTLDPRADPAEAAVLDEGVRLAALVVLDRLGPEQRVAFVLHDAFGVPFDEIAAVLGCAVATARQHASRGRRAAADAAPPSRVALTEQRELIERFVAALGSGDVDAVVALLHPDAVVVGDGGGRARTALHPVVGADKVARFLLGLIRKYGGLSDAVPVLVNGDLGFRFAEREDLAARVGTFTFRDGKVSGLFDISNPDKLRHVTF